jgi:hypothetical protein
MSYERDEAMRQQEATEAMIRMREPRRSSGPHPDPCDELIGEMAAALKAAKQQMWIDARPTWTMADFKNWAVIQQIDAALTRADGLAR